MHIHRDGAPQSHQIEKTFRWPEVGRTNHPPSKNHFRANFEMARLNLRPKPPLGGEDVLTLAMYSSRDLVQRRESTPHTETPSSSLLGRTARMWVLLLMLTAPQ